MLISQTIYSIIYKWRGFLILCFLQENILNKWIKQTNKQKQSCPGPIDTHRRQRPAWAMSWGRPAGGVQRCEMRRERRARKPAAMKPAVKGLCGRWRLRRRTRWSQKGSRCQAAPCTSAWQRQPVRLQLGPARPASLFQFAQRLNKA